MVELNDENGLGLHGPISPGVQAHPKISAISHLPPSGFSLATILLVLQLDSKQCGCDALPLDECFLQTPVELWVQIWVT